MSQTFAEKVKQLNLPADQFIIIGSGLLEQLGLRKYEVEVEPGGLYLSNRHFVRSWKVWRNRPKDIPDIGLIDNYKEKMV